MGRLANPAAPGASRFDRMIYASAGLNYGNIPALAAEYGIFDNPAAGFVTPRIDISAFAQLGNPLWPFDPTTVPLNGLVRVPRGRGPFPLAVFAHGNHSPLENSTPGYVYLCELLASHGIIAATIDVNFLNGANFGENDGRAIVHLEHLKQFRVWNATPGHRLHRRVDLDRAMIIGHSRGGEGVGHASLFNRLGSVQPDLFSPVVPLDGSAGLGPYGFGIRAVAAIAPTDRQYEPVTGPTVVPDDYFLIHGSRDGDVSDFEGYNTYNRTHGVDLADPTASDGHFKALTWVIGANHNQFNSAWASETPAATTITRAAQEQVARVALGALAQDVLLGRGRYRKVLRDHAVATPWLPVGTDLVSQYQDPSRVFLVHNQEGLGPPQLSAPIQGVEANPGVVPTRNAFNLVNAFAPTPTITLQLVWNALGAALDLDIDPTSLPHRRFAALALRIGQSTEPANPAGQDQDLTLVISSGSRTAAIPASSLHRLRYPDDLTGPGKTVMQSLRLSRRRLRRLGIDVRDLRSVRLVFDRTPAGVVYVGDLQLTD
jgi:hypothetical protein